MHDPDDALRARLSLAPLPDHRWRGHRSRLVVDGAPTRTAVDGLVLEAALATEHGTLLLTTDDCYFEEILHATLLDERWRVLDELGLGLTDTSAWLHELERVDANRVRFGFFGQDEWTLAAHAPRWRVHLIASTVTHFLGPVTRPFGRLLARSRLRLEGSYLVSGERRMRVRC